ncbi:hypothetical protein SLS60_010287 [Paraconiothyrium brasiliense]|uniref:Karyogamy protein 5 n=1 Tax=Paraconiothyrium brasiliense TaxID=300254 RepID=A0ABR3QQU8_9PLEO
MCICTVILAMTITMTSAQRPSPCANHGRVIDPQLSLVMRANAQISGDTELKETWAWLEHLSSKPACTQLATSKLTAECQLLENPSEFARVYPGQVLEDVQNEYALKLAICEFVGAQNAYDKAPPKCHAFLPTNEACAKRSWWGKDKVDTDELCYPKSNEANLQQCLATMQASPQTWTSYSNARSRAMHICHLTRQHIETERAIQVHKNLTLVVAKMHDSVQPLESKIHSMNEELHTFSDEFRRSFVQSQQVADAGLRNMQSGLTASQQQIDEHYSTFQTRLADHYELMIKHRNDSLAQFAITIDNFIQARTLELTKQFRTHTDELQEYHSKNMLAVQQDHETTVQSFDILRTGLSSAKSDVDGLNDKISALEDKLEGSIAQVQIVNESLGNLASMAQTAGRFLRKIETFAAYVGSGFVLIWLVLLTGYLPAIPKVGNTCRLLAVFALTLLVCGVSLYYVPWSSSVPFKLHQIAETSHEANLSMQNFG